MREVGEQAGAGCQLSLAWRGPCALKWVYALLMYYKFTTKTHREPRQRLRVPHTCKSSARALAAAAAACASSRSLACSSIACCSCSRRCSAAWAADRARTSSTAAASTCCCGTCA